MVPLEPGIYNNGAKMIEKAFIIYSKQQDAYATCNDWGSHTFLKGSKLPPYLFKSFEQAKGSITRAMNSYKRTKANPRYSSGATMERWAEILLQIQVIEIEIEYKFDEGKVVHLSLFDADKL